MHYNRYKQQNLITVFDRKIISDIIVSLQRVVYKIRKAILTAGMHRILVQVFINKYIKSFFKYFSFYFFLLCIHMTYSLHISYHLNRPPEMLTVGENGTNVTSSSFSSVFRISSCYFVNKAAASGSRDDIKDSAGIPACRILTDY